MVSKNGNLLLNIPVRGDGTIDEIEYKVVEEIAAWMQINGEGIYGTRPWATYGEGPAIESAALLSAQGFNEGKGKPFGSEDMRFTTKGKILYAIVFGWPKENKTVIKTIALNNSRKVSRVSLLGYHEALNFQQTAEGLQVIMPDQASFQNAFVLKIEDAIA